MKTLLTAVMILWAASAHAYGINLLIIGQSNASGMAKIEMEDKTPIAGAFVLNRSHKFEAAREPLNRYSNLGKKSHGMSFAHTLLAAFAEEPGVNPYAIVNARGRTNIDCWSKGGKCYDKTLNRTLRRHIDIDVVFYQQGEADKARPEYWLSAMIENIKQWRIDLGNQDLPFIVGMIPETLDGAAEFNAIVATLPTVIDNVAVVSSAGLTMKPDGVHYDNAGAKELGLRMYDAYNALVGR